MSKNLINALQIEDNIIKFITAQEIEIANNEPIIQVLSISEKKGIWDISKLDIDLLASYIKTSLLENEKLVGQKIVSTLVSVTKEITSKYITHELFLNDIEITEEHIKSFYQSRDFSDLYEDDKIPIHTLPISYKINDKKIVSDPLGLKAQTLTIKWHIISINKKYHQNINKLLEASDLHMKQCVLASYASSLASINEMESSLGVICIDLNYFKTDITIIIDNQLVCIDNTDIGIKYVNLDLMNILEISEEEANLLRLKWNSEINKKNLSESESRIQQIIKYRMEEIIDLAFTKIEKSSYYDLANSHVVLTGEGVKYYDAIEYSSHVFKTKNIRIGFPQKIHGLKPVIDNPANSTCVGMLNYALSTEFQYDVNDNKTKKDSVISILYNFFRAI